jgi:hypothetical protein
VTTIVPPRVLGEWRSAEDRLYPVVMLRPDLYERSVELVRKVADELAATCADVEALGAAWPQAADLVYRVSSLALMPLGDLDVSLVAGASFSLRYREMAAAVARTERSQKVREALDAGESWLELEVSGTPETAVYFPYSRLEMHLGSGFGLRSTLEADAGTGQPRFLVERLHLDPATGEVLESLGTDVFVSRAAWEAALRDHRRDIEGDATGG